MITNNSIKEYYVKLQGMYENCYNMLQAISQSLTTQASEISVKISNTDGTYTSVNIPSFLYLDNKIEELDTNFSALFDMPDSGDAWMTKSSDMFKLSLMRSGTAPLKPEYDRTNIYAGLTDNNFLKDLVSPKTFLKFYITNLPDNINQVMMKKIIFFNSDIFNSIKNLDISSYEEYKAALYNFIAGTDYEEYDSILDIPVRRDIYKSRFEIVDIPLSDSTGTSNPWIDQSDSNTRNKLSYRLKLSTLQYTDQEDSSIVFTLKVGDQVCISNKSVVYTIKNVDTSEMEVIVEESVGHLALQPYSENTEMVLQIYNKDYSAYHYIQVPLEENKYIAVFLSTIYNNVRSELSDAYLIDLSTVYIKDAAGNYIDDSYGNHLTYIDYYNKYCTNIGDLILGLTETAYPQISNFSTSILESLQEGSSVQDYVTNTFDTENILQVVPINKHLTDDVTTDDIINLHTQKNDINQQLNTVQDNISQVYNTIISTDFSQETSITQESLQSKLQQYYTERTTLQKQLSAIVDNINTKSVNLNIVGNEVKYRIRGITDTDLLESYIHNIAGDNVYVIGMDVEYKYKSPIKDSNSVTIINSSTFTDWVKLSNIDRQRKLIFNSSSSSYSLDFVDYNTTDNIVKWNQVDIPIQQGEDVIIRIRYKVNIGQPFFNLYTPWSDEKTMIFPDEYTEDIDLTTILNQNEDDTIVANFRNTLINEGYSEHIQNKVINSDQIFYHMPENIYSGFNTSENNLISLKDKLLEFNNSIEEYKTALDNETNSKFEVYLNYDESSVKLESGVINTINIYNNEHISDKFIKKNMNIVIKNTGDVRLNLYSIFPGNTDISLLNSNMEFYNQKIGNYERVPIFLNNILSGQYLGQWIYFRETNPYTNNDIYYTTIQQNNSDYNKVNDKKSLQYDIESSEYMPKDNKQVLLGYRNRGVYSTINSTILSEGSYSTKWSRIAVGDKIKDTEIYKVTFNKYNSDTNTESSEGNNTGTVSDKIYNTIQEINNKWYIYPTNKNCNYLMRYEDIYGLDEQDTTQTPIYLDENTDFIEFRKNCTLPTAFLPDENETINDKMVGAFLYPNILSKEEIITKGQEKDSVYIEVGESKSIPVVFEYYVNSTKNTITKSLYFDLRNSLIRDPYHYMIEIKGYYDYTSSAKIYNSSVTVAGDSASETNNN